MIESFCSMVTSSDCGPTLLGNLIGYVLSSNAEEIKAQVIQRHKFPNDESFRDDFWDNPVKHEEVIKDFLVDRGLCLRVVGESYGGPVGVLLRNKSNPTLWHWVMYLGPNFLGEQLWHNGKTLVTFQSNVTKFLPDDWSEVIRYAITSSSNGEKLKWYWYAWRYFTRIFVS